MLKYANFLKNNCESCLSAVENTNQKWSKVLNLADRRDEIFSAFLWITILLLICLWTCKHSHYYVVVVWSRWPFFLFYCNRQ